MMDCLPINLTDLPSDTKSHYENIVQKVNNLFFRHKKHVFTYFTFYVQLQSLEVGNSGNEVMDEIISTNYQKELARMEMVSQSLDGILGQIDAMKQQFVADFGERCEMT